jgi:hypothetical protein
MIVSNNETSPMGMPSTSERPSTRLVAIHVLNQPLVKVKLMFLVASFVSLLLSVSLWFSGHELQGVFVGIWVPSILSVGALLLAGESSTPR